MPCIVLDENAGEALEGAKHGAVDHDWRGLLTVGPDIKGAKSLRHVEIDLDRAALPVAADGIVQHIFELWTVERALARIELIVQACSFDRPLERGFRLVPHLVRAAAPHRPIREVDAHIFEAEIAVERWHLLVPPT